MNNFIEMYLNYEAFYIKNELRIATIPINRKLFLNFDEKLVYQKHYLLVHS